MMKMKTGVICAQLKLVGSRCERSAPDVGSPFPSDFSDNSKVVCPYYEPHISQNNMASDMCWQKLYDDMVQK